MCAIDATPDDLRIRTDYIGMWHRIEGELQAHLLANTQLKSLVIGISGGIDSALCCALAQPVCKKLGIQLIGRTISIYSDEDEIIRAKRVGKMFCDSFGHEEMEYAHEVIISNMLLKRNEVSFEEKIRRGNIKARLRMIYLFDLAHRNNGMVLSTDNLTEWMLGFWTLHGDVGNYGLFQNLWKTEVYGLAHLMVKAYKDTDKSRHAKVMQLCINAVPSDGLGITESDFDQLGHDNYQDIDQIFQDLLVNNIDVDYDDPVIDRHLNTHFKRRDPISISRQEIIGRVPWTSHELRDAEILNLLKKTVGEQT